MSRLSSLRFVLGMFGNKVSLHALKLIECAWVSQTVKPCASLQAHTYSLCAVVAGRCYKMDGSIMSLKTTGWLHATQLGSRTNSNGSESVQSVLWQDKLYFCYFRNITYEYLGINTIQSLKFKLG